MPLGKMNKGFFFLACLFLLELVPAGKVAGSISRVHVKLPIDSSKVITNKITPETFKQFFNSKDFIYDRKQPVINSFWEKIAYKIGQVFQFAFNNQVFSILIILIFFVVFVLLIVLLVGGDFQTIFSRNKPTQGSVSLFTDESIEQTDFDQLISREIESGNLNLAVRYLYLKLLQVLSQQQYILWQKDKTNREYAQELSQRAFFYDFKRVTNAYEYVWYGKFQISMQVLCDVRDNVNQLIEQIHG
jgi:hypothetical protein